MAPSEKWIGRSIERFEDEALLSGRARFIDDLEPVPGLCHAAILRRARPFREAAQIPATSWGGFGVSAPSSPVLSSVRH